MRGATTVRHAWRGRGRGVARGAVAALTHNDGDLKL